jgi:dGTPase
VADHADEVAYLVHDLDDGLRSKLLTLGLLEEVPLWRETRRRVQARLGDAEERVQRAQTLVALVDLLVTGLVEETARRIGRSDARDVDAVRTAKEPLAGFSPALAAEKATLKEFLYENLYHHPSVRRMAERGERVLTDLFLFLREHPERLPRRLAGRLAEEGEARAVADYVAGMTDRFALSEHERRFGA